MPNKMKIDSQKVHEIFDRIREDKDNVEELYTFCYNLVYRIAFSYVKNRSSSEDIVQIVFTKIYNMSKEMFPTRSEMSWIYAVTKNETLAYMRNEDILSINNIEFESRDDELDEIIDIETYNKLVAGLNDTDREIVTMKVLGELGFREISNILKMPMGTVQWRYYKSLHSIKIILTNLVISILAITGFTVKKVLNKKETQKEDNSNQNNQIENSLENEKNNSVVEDSNQNNHKENNVNNNTNTTIDITKEIKNLDKIDISLLSIAGIFLIFSLIFSFIFVKYQQKGDKKSSK